MKLNDQRYQKQYLHADVVVFTVENRQIKVLLVQRGREPYIGDWALPGGATYASESVDDTARRELAYKTGLKGIYLEQFQVFSQPKRDPRARIVAVGYLALVDKNKVSLLQKTPKTLGAKWFSIYELPALKWDHKKIIAKAIETLRYRIIYSNIICELLPPRFTLPDLHRAYEIILGKKLDRRNFRRKLLNSGLIKATATKASGGQHRPAIYYQFKNKKHQEVIIF